MTFFIPTSFDVVRVSVRGLLRPFFFVTGKLSLRSFTGELQSWRVHGTSSIRQMIQSLNLTFHVSSERDLGNVASWRLENENAITFRSINCNTNDLKVTADSVAY